MPDPATRPRRRRGVSRQQRPADLVAVADGRRVRDCQPGRETWSTRAPGRVRAAARLARRLRARLRPGRLVPSRGATLRGLMEPAPAAEGECCAPGRPQPERRGRDAELPDATDGSRQVEPEIRTRALHAQQSPPGVDGHPVDLCPVAARRRRRQHPFSLQDQDHRVVGDHWRRVGGPDLSIEPVPQPSRRYRSCPGSHSTPMTCQSLNGRAGVTSCCGRIRRTPSSP